MTMNSMTMKQLSIVLIVSLWSLMNGKAIGYAVPQDDPHDQTYGNRSPCMDGFIRLASGKCYFFSFKGKTWTEALAICQSVGATLAYPINIFEDSVLASYLKANFNELSGWFLGGNDRRQAGEWVWAHNNAPLRYFDWAPGEPTSLISNWRCLQYYSSHWQWSNANCKSTLPFVCQQL